ncbi:MAG TPA: hypothetical protein VGB79_06310 [Allosphingosinicella sp.]|jgi:hypothetical protein
MLEAANAAASRTTLISAVMAAPAEEFGTVAEDFSGLERLIESSDAQGDTSPDLYQIAPAVDPELSDGVQYSQDPDIVVTGPPRPKSYIIILTDPGPTGADLVPLDHEVLHDGAGGGLSDPLLMELQGSSCPVEKAAATDSLQSLYDNSPTARALIEAAVAAGVDLNLFTAHTSGSGAQPRFKDGVIHWDPFFAISGTNTDGSEYTLTPIMILAHELVHAGNAGNPAYQLNPSEPLVMTIANQIAREMNAATGSNYDTTRDSHEGPERFYTVSSTSETPAIARPGCS